MGWGGDMNHMEVFYIDRSTGWAAAKFDANRNQVGDAQFYYHKRDAVSDAESTGLPVHKYTAEGKLR